MFRVLIESSSFVGGRPEGGMAESYLDAFYGSSAPVASASAPRAPRAPRGSQEDVVREMAMLVSGRPSKAVNKELNRLKCSVLHLSEIPVRKLVAVQDRCSQISCQQTSLSELPSKVSTLFFSSSDTRRLPAEKARNRDHYYRLGNLAQVPKVPKIRGPVARRGPPLKMPPDILMKLEESFLKVYHQQHSCLQAYRRTGFLGAPVVLLRTANQAIRRKGIVVANHQRSLHICMNPLKMVEVFPKVGLVFALQVPNQPLITGAALLADDAAAGLDS